MVSHIIYRDGNVLSMINCRENTFSQNKSLYLSTDMYLALSPPINILSQAPNYEDVQDLLKLMGELL